MIGTNLRKRLCVTLAAAMTAGPAISSSPADAQSATSYNYDAKGRLIGVRDGTGVKTDYAYDKADNRANVAAVLQFAQSWAATSLYHMIGRADSGGWSAYVLDPAGFMVYGPYTNGVPTGARVAAFRLLIDNNSANNANVATIDVWDATALTSLATRTLMRQEWKTVNAYEVFELPFTLPNSSAGHELEFRVYYLQTAYIRVDKVGYR